MCLGSRRLGHPRQPVSRYGKVELHGMGEHDARGLSMRHMTMATELMADRMADAGAHRGEAHDRHPGPQLTMQAGVEILWVARRTRQMMEKIAQCLLTEGIRQWVVFGGIEPFDGMIDRPHAGRGPEPVRCVNGDLRVKNDNARRDLWSTEALFDAAHGIGNADTTGEFAGR